MNRTILPARDYDLDATLASGQVFRWREVATGWEGVLGGHWVRLQQVGEGIDVASSYTGTDWKWVSDFLQLDVDYTTVLESFPKDEPMERAVAACRGLRLLRQDPWECLVSFICSSTKQIVQIMGIVRLLCERFGEPVKTPAGIAPVFSFPTPAQLARSTDERLRACKTGFRAPFILDAARNVADGNIDLSSLRSLPTNQARAALMSIHGVGRKIADCVLLFAFGFQDAFPVDVWVEKALQNFYFPRRRVNASRLRRFSETHFGPHSGYAQQYLFHYARTIAMPRGRALRPESSKKR